MQLVILDSRFVPRLSVFLQHRVVQWPYIKNIDKKDIVSLKVFFVTQIRQMIHEKAHLGPDKVNLRNLLRTYQYYVFKPLVPSLDH